jgi:hypothetical protein
MSRFWDEATFLLETLVMKVVSIDQDGVDLSFTSGSMEVTSHKELKRFTAAMRDKTVVPTPGVHTDMTRTLGPILSTYLRTLKSGLKRGSVGRGLTLIVLTDGLWQGMLDGSALAKMIADFATQLVEVVGTFRDRTASIEFVSFGNDDHAIERLRRLDDNLSTTGIP